MITTIAKWADFLGIIGVGLTLLAYFLLNINHLSAKGKVYPLLNLVGSSLIMYSLLFHWNTPAVLMEGAWILISLYGACKAFSLQPEY